MGSGAGVDDPSGRHRVGVVLFDGFELLDVAGPLELYGHVPDHFELCLVGPQAGPVRSAQGVEVVAEHAYADAPAVGIVMVPGGMGTRRLVGDREFLDWLGTWAAQAPLVTSVCTGSALLAAAGLLDGYQATSNKQSFAWVVAQGPKVQWVAKARWVENQDRWTSSGVAAGMDMTLALIGRLHGADLAERVAQGVEYDWHQDPSWDPFAVIYGLGA